MIFETCSTVYLDVNYMINEFDSEIQTYANMSYQYEKEDNDTEDYADVIVLGRTVSATVSKNYDVDYFYINLTSPQYKNTRFSNGTFKILLSTNGNTSVYLTMRLFAVRDGALKSIATGILPLMEANLYIETIIQKITNFTSVLHPVIQFLLANLNITSTLIITQAHHFIVKK